MHTILSEHARPGMTLFVTAQSCLPSLFTAHRPLARAQYLHTRTAMADSTLPTVEPSTIRIRIPYQRPVDEQIIVQPPNSRWASLRRKLKHVFSLDGWLNIVLTCMCISSICVYKQGTDWW